LTDSLYIQPLKFVVSDEKLVMNYRLERICKEAAVIHQEFTRKERGKPLSGQPMSGLRFEISTSGIRSRTCKRSTAYHADKSVLSLIAMICVCNVSQFVLSWCQQVKFQPLVICTAQSHVSVRVCTVKRLLDETKSSLYTNRYGVPRGVLSSCFFLCSLLSPSFSASFFPSPFYLSRLFLRIFVSTSKFYCGGRCDRLCMTLDPVSTTGVVKS
jgi:hypothetical protein